MSSQTQALEFSRQRTASTQPAEPLPAYRQVIFKSGSLQVKKEMSSPVKESNNRKWLPCSLSINGTQLVLVTGKLLATTNILSLQFARVGIASDYTKVENCFRVRVEGQQYLFAAQSLKEVLEWVLALQISIDLSLPIDLRPMPELPRRRGPRLTEPPLHCPKSIRKWPSAPSRAETERVSAAKAPLGPKGTPPTKTDFRSLKNSDPWAGLIYYNGTFASVERSAILPMRSHRVS